MPRGKKKLVHFVMCSCGNHGCFTRPRYQSKELYTRDEVDHYVLLYLLKDEIEYKEADRIFKEMNRTEFPHTFHPCLLDQTSP